MAALLRATLIVQLISVLLLFNCTNLQRGGGGKTIYFSSLTTIDIAWRWLHTIVAYLFHPRGQSADRAVWDEVSEWTLHDMNPV